MQVAPDDDWEDAGDEDERPRGAQDAGHAGVYSWSTSDRDHGSCGYDGLMVIRPLLFTGIQD